VVTFNLKALGVSSSHYVHGMGACTVVAPLQAAQLVLAEVASAAFCLTCLSGVVAYVDVRTECDNRSRAVESVLRQLGATVSVKLSKDVTHVIFKDGKKRTRDVALRRRLHFVSVLWLVR